MKPTPITTHQQAAAAMRSATLCFHRPPSIGDAHPMVSGWLVQGWHLNHSEDIQRRGLVRYLHADSGEVAECEFIIESPSAPRGLSGDIFIDEIDVPRRFIHRAAFLGELWRLESKAKRFAKRFDHLWQQGTEMSARRFKRACRELERNRDRAERLRVLLGQC